MSSTRKALARSGTVLALTAPLGLVGLAPSYAGQTTDHVVCSGQNLTLRVNESNSSEHGGWGAVQVIAGGTGHLIPIAFSGTATDVTIHRVIFSFEGPKGGGHPASEGAESCVLHLDGTIADFYGPDEPLPAGVALTDVVSFDITALVIHKG